MNTLKRIQETKQASRKNPEVEAKWLDYIQDESLNPVAIPVGPRFQADLPDWIGPPNNDIEKESKWLGTQVWPIKNDPEETNEARIGKGRPEFCNCGSPGSVECVRRHVGEERKKLESELGPAFQEWRFDEMGEDVSDQWSLREQRKFESIVKRNNPLLSQGKSFLQAAMAAFPSHNKHSILNYYFNVYLPRRFSKETRSDHREAAGTDDEETNSRCLKKRRFVY
ncbi:AT-rich interactive domain-containing protein 1-like [Ipomoea triloba]|uniref:AT-rich interactive domain-containing protein 1-like n=1 Tax=Ipomoea triloba TaxID=35885 RepID=UPI00125E3707|nr:AT-rich interactive domain-containing protein 1-like [Ipomoea triloba]